MGEHKHNPTAIAAKKGELPPKPKKLSKKECERLVFKAVQDIMPSLPIEHHYTMDI